MKWKMVDKWKTERENYVFRIPKFGKKYLCNHPVYSFCTLYKHGDFGLAVIQQRFDSHTKSTFWGVIDNYLVDTIHENPGFEAFFCKYAGHIDENGCYPTVTVRQIMRALKMKPLPKARWETVFDHKPI